MVRNGTTYESRFKDPEYVNGLLLALREKAKDVARVRSRVVALREQNKKRLATLADKVGADSKDPAWQYSTFCAAVAASSAAIGGAGSVCTAPVAVGDQGDRPRQV